ncbi:MAG: hypothetical protein MUF54_14205 [Polyangiaceae bacterium]|jgi:hypothetical protein|nr:hypothetical protein [Polyangiaceae bacterium]
METSQHTLLEAAAVVAQTARWKVRRKMNEKIAKSDPELAKLRGACQTRSRLPSPAGLA